MNSPNPSQPDQEDRRRRFVQLFSQHQRRVQRYILSLIPNWTDADEVFAETNVRLWEQFDEYDVEKDFGSWACTIAHYQVLTRRKELARRGNVLSDASLDALAEQAWETSQPSERRMTALQYCLKKLSDVQRQLIGQVYGDNLRLAEVAESLGQSTTAVAKRLSRLRKTLYNCIEGQLAQEGER